MTAKLTLPSDLRGVLFGTPAYGGQFAYGYVTSMLRTTTLLTGLGVPHELMGVINEANVQRARNAIAAAFLSRPEFSTLLFIDADMAWKAEDVVRLLLDDFPVAMGVGPKKIEGPREYGVNFIDETLRVTPNGCVEIHSGGACFLAIKRVAIERLVAAHPELTYNAGSPWDPVVGIFNPFLDEERRTYWSEDLAFCLRWRALGEKVYLDPRIDLKHFGLRCWEGKTLEMFATREPAADVPAEAAAG